MNIHMGLSNNVIGCRYFNTAVFVYCWLRANLMYSTYRLMFVHFVSPFHDCIYGSKYNLYFYCPRGSDGLYCFRREFFLSVSTITHEPLHSAW